MVTGAVRTRPRLASANDRRETIHTSPALTREAAGWVDSQVAAVAGRVGPAQFERLVAETIKRFDLAVADPAADPEDGYLSVDPRQATPNSEDVHFAGTLHFEADLDLADGLDLDRALVHGAALQKALGSTESLDVRRATALGDLARTQTALDLLTGRPGPDTRRQGRVNPSPDLPAAREVVLHAHFDATSVGDQTVFGPTGRLEEGQRLVLLDQVKAWCGDSRTKVTIKPVIDLTTELSTPAYAVPDRIREQVALRDHTCVFPWRTRPARRRDVDHVIEHDRRRDGRSTTTRTHCHAQPRKPVSVPPPHQDPHGLAPPDDLHRCRRVDHSPRPPVPTGSHRHHICRRTRIGRTTMTPLRTPPKHHPAGAPACPNRTDRGMSGRSRRAKRAGSHGSGLTEMDQDPARCHAMFEEAGIDGESLTVVLVRGGTRSEVLRLLGAAAEANREPVFGPGGHRVLRVRADRGRRRRCRIRADRLRRPQQTSAGPGSRSSEARLRSRAPTSRPTSDSVAPATASFSTATMGSGRYGFTEVRSQAVMDMQFRRMTAMDRHRLKDRLEQVAAEVEALQAEVGPVT